MLEPCDAGDSSGTLFPESLFLLSLSVSFWSVFYVKYVISPVINAFLTKHFLWILG